MNFYHALIDDLIGIEEFNAKVEEKVTESGDLLDGHAAAMLVVREYGRHHTKICDLNEASSLASFFGKVLSITPPHEFKRPDGDTGVVASMTVGDATGEVRVVLWDEKAQALRGEIEPGMVMEILGRPKGSPLQVSVVSLRESSCEIICSQPEEGQGRVAPAPDSGCTIEVRLISVAHRTFTRRDGSGGEMAEAVIGNEDGVFRLVCWAPALLAGVADDTCIRITGASRGENRHDHEIEYILGEEGGVTAIDREIEIPLTTPADVTGEGRYSLRGVITSLQPPRRFTTRSGGVSWVRNLVISGGGGDVRTVIWGDAARLHLLRGETAEIYNATAKPGRYSDLEVHIGRGSAIRVIHDDAKEEIAVTGTVIPSPAGTCIDTGSECYLLDEPTAPGTEVTVQGTVSRREITPGRYEAAVLRAGPLLERVEIFLDRVSQ